MNERWERSESGGFRSTQRRRALRLSVSIALCWDLRRSPVCPISVEPPSFVISVCNCCRVCKSEVGVR